MKKKLLFLPFVAALALTACSDDEPAVNGGNGEADGEERYMAVSIVSTPSVGSRAGEQYELDGATFEDGLTTENSVSGIRLYFFNSVGDPVSVRGQYNYYDVPKNEISGSTAVHGETVERQLDAVIIVNPDEQLPAQILAVVNPHIGNDDGALPDNVSMTLDAALKKVDQYDDLANDNGQFVMTNAVYMDGRKTISAKTVTPENYGKTPEDAKTNAVTIYVERNVAKVRTNIAQSMESIDAPEGNTKLYKVLKYVTTEGTESEEGKEANVTETQMKVGVGDKAKDVYVKFLGWDITATLPYAYLSKHLDPEWVTRNPLGQMAWNSLKYQRSYWAAVCDGGDKNNNEYFSFNDDSKFKKTAFDGSAWKYCNENAERNGTMDYKATKVIIKAELCDAQGNPLTISEYAGARVLEPDAECSNLKNRFLLMLTTAKANSYFKEIEEVGGTKTYKEISAEDITFQTAAADDKTLLDDDKAGRYYVYACLADESKGATWYPQSSFEKVTNEDGTEGFKLKEGAKKAEVADINSALKTLGHAKIWESGMTYYYTDIMHFSTQGDLAGVVRNHLYNIEFTKVYGLGTPVYDPNEIVIPEKPQKDDTYLAAKINILSWRYVPTSVTLDWND